MGTPRYSTVLEIEKEHKREAEQGMCMQQTNTEVAGTSTRASTMIALLYYLIILKSFKSTVQ